MNTRNRIKTNLAKEISETLNVTVNMAYKYIRGASELSFAQAKRLKDNNILSYEDIENLENICASTNKKKTTQEVA